MIIPHGIWQYLGTVDKENFFAKKSLFINVSSSTEIEKKQHKLKRSLKIRFKLINRFQFLIKAIYRSFFSVIKGGVAIKPKLQDHMTFK